MAVPTASRSPTAQCRPATNSPNPKRNLPGDWRMEIKPVCVLWALLLAGLSQEAAHIIDPTYEVNPAANYYFMFVSTFFIATAGTWVTEKIVEPRLGKYEGATPPEDAESSSAPST